MNAFFCLLVYKFNKMYFCFEFMFVFSYFLYLQKHFYNIKINL